MDESRLYNAVIFDEAKELVDKLITETNLDILADIMDHVVQSSDLSHAVLFYLLAHARTDMKSARGVSGVEIANSKPTFDSLIIIGGDRK